jgi:hypothetical protein
MYFSYQETPLIPALSCAGMRVRIQYYWVYISLQYTTMISMEYGA